MRKTSPGLIGKILGSGTGVSSKRAIAVGTAMTLCICLILNFFIPGITGLNPSLIDNIGLICIAAIGGTAAEKFSKYKPDKKTEENVDEVPTD